MSSNRLITPGLAKRGGVNTNKKTPPPPPPKPAAKGPQKFADAESFEEMTEVEINLGLHREEAMLKAIDALSRYKFQMFGYWAGIWVHLNNIHPEPQSNPFRTLVKEANRLKQ